MSSPTNGASKSSLLEMVKNVLDSSGKASNETVSINDEVEEDITAKAQDTTQSTRSSPEAYGITEKPDEPKTPTTKSLAVTKSSPLSPLTPLPDSVLGDLSLFASRSGKGHRSKGKQGTSPCSPSYSPITSPIKAKIPAEHSSPLQQKLDKATESRGEKRKRSAANGPIYTQDFEPPYRAATMEEKDCWQGFCEIESEPAIFNLMLREWGVKGVKIQELFGLDCDSLAMLPQPVYGLIFLFQYGEEDAGDQDETCPSHVWFANQVTNNSCATVALLNMVNNLRDVDIGETLQTFRVHTQLFSPALRGEQAANFPLIKRVHNSFARKIDMLEADLVMEGNFEESKKRKKTARKSNTRRSRKTEVDDSAFHFVAFMPILGEVWKLDGLDNTPQLIPLDLPRGDLSSISSSELGIAPWLTAIADRLQTRMLHYQNGGIEFNLLALVKDPLDTAQIDLARNLRLARAVDDGNDDENDRATIAIHDLSEYGIHPDHLLEPPNPEDRTRLVNSSRSQKQLEELIKSVREEGESLRMRVQQEQSAVNAEEEKAKDKRNDYGPFIQKWLMMLAENGVLRELVEGEE
jgi:ubiquitin carboxyl-terminal hydrolase L5